MDPPEEVYRGSTGRASTSKLAAQAGGSATRGVTFVASAIAMSLLPRVLEPEVMDDEREAVEYDAMDHAGVNRAFVDALLAMTPDLSSVLDVGTGTARIPLTLWQLAPASRIRALDLADAMLDVARKNVVAAGAAGAIELVRGDGKRLPFADGSHHVVMSNSIVHHVPEPASAFAEMVRVLAPGGVLFVRDLFRPRDEAELSRLVEEHAKNDSPEQRRLFADSLRAALTPDEVRARVAPLGVPAGAVTTTSDRHWTLAWRKA